MPRLTGGQALARALALHGAEVAFGLPGVQIYHLLDGLYGEPGIRFITTRHEQSTTYMADGYARTSGKVGVAVVVPGPGVYNAGAGLATAYAASSPVLLVAGQVRSDMLGRGRGMLHEVHDQLEVVRPVTKWCARLLSVEEIPPAVHHAFGQMRSGRPRPVALEVPPDVLSATAEVELPEPEAYPAPSPDPAQVEEAARLLARAQRPLIWAGGGVNISGAWGPLRRVAERLQALVTTTPEGKGALPHNHPLLVGVTNPWFGPGWELLGQADAVLAVGTRLGPPEAPIPHRPPRNLVQIDIDPQEVGRIWPVSVGVVADARLALEALLKALERHSPPRPPRTEEARRLRRAREERLRRIQPQASFVEALREAIPPEGVLVSGMTQVGYVCETLYPVLEPRTFITSSYMGTLGYEYPTALGAQVGSPDRPVVAVVGDGGFLYSATELATAVLYNIPAVAVVFNDNAYGNPLRDQQLYFGGRVIGARLHNPDFLRFAESFGALALRAHTPEDLCAALKRALSLRRPTVIEVPVGPMPEPA